MKWGLAYEENLDSIDGMYRVDFDDLFLFVPMSRISERRRQHYD
jgi:hypothetical protein